MGIEDRLCPRHLPIIAKTTIHFSENAVTQSRIFCLHLIKLHPNSGILARKGEKDRTYFIRKASHDYLRHSDQNASQLRDGKQKFLTVLGTESNFVKRHFMGGGQMKVKPWNTQSTKTVAFLQLLCDFWFVFVFSMSIVLKGHSLPSLEPSSHWPINSGNGKRPRCSREVLSMWEGSRGSTCREHNQPDDEMSGHPTRFPDLLFWQIEGE